MARTRISWLLAALLTLAGSLHAQERSTMISLYGSFTTSSKLFYNPDATDLIERNQNLPLDDVFGLGIDVRHAITDQTVILGLSVEYLRSIEAFRVAVTPGFTVPVRDGYEAIPVELSGYFVIPFSSQSIAMYIGGGGGLYFGRRIYEMADVATRSEYRHIGAGIQVMTGLQVHISGAIAARSELKFRDVSFNTGNSFGISSVEYAGRVVRLDTGLNESRISIDGMVLTVGVVFLF